MEKDRKEPVIQLQNNLEAIRKIAGWTAEELGDRIGVTKQTISNLENKKTQMTLTQYIAIRSILDYEVQTNKENVVLGQAINILLDQSEEYSEDEREALKEKVNIIAATAVAGITGATLTSLSATLLGGPIIGGIAVGASLWMPQILKKVNKKKPKKV